MSVEIIKVEELKAASWTEQALDSAKQQAKARPYLVLPILGVGGVYFAPFIATGAMTLAAGAVVGLVGTGISELFWGPDADLPINYLSIEEAALLTDIHGQALMRGATYLRHPRPIREMSIIKAVDFHSYVMKQKVSEIIHYLRAATNLKSLQILIRSSDSKYAFVEGTLKKMTAEIGIDRKNSNELRMILSCNNEDKPNHLENYVWLDDFPEVVAATKNVRNGAISFTQSTDMTFGLSSGIAKIANVKTEWLSTFIFEIDATFQ